MEIAVLADIHGNYAALSRCITYAVQRHIDTFLFLGDYVGELAYPEKAMELINSIKKTYRCYFIRGNKEDYWIDYKKNRNSGAIWEDRNSASGMLLYAYQHLTEQDIEFFETLPISRRIEIPGFSPFLICHGSPERTNEKLIPENTRIHKIVLNAGTDLILCGHTHKQHKAEYDGRTVLNPGSVGLPFLSGGKSQFLILHGGGQGWREEFISLEYDVDSVISDMRKERLEIRAPYWTYTTMKILKGGEISSAAVLSRAAELCRIRNGSCSWPQIPETCWEQAFRELYG